VVVLVEVVLVVVAAAAAAAAARHAVSAFVIELITLVVARWQYQ